MIDLEKYEVKNMENNELELEQEQQEQPQGYTPRPKWQLWLARIALVIFLGFLFMYYMNILRSGA